MVTKSENSSLIVKEEKRDTLVEAAREVMLLRLSGELIFIYDADPEKQR